MPQSKQSDDAILKMAYQSLFNEDVMKAMDTFSPEAIAVWGKHATSNDLIKWMYIHNKKREDLPTSLLNAMWKNGTPLGEKFIAEVSPGCLASSPKNVISHFRDIYAVYKSEAGEYLADVDVAYLAKLHHKEMDVWAVADALYSLLEEGYRDTFLTKVFSLACEIIPPPRVEQFQDVFFDALNYSFGKLPLIDESKVPDYPDAVRRTLTLLKPAPLISMVSCRETLNLNDWITLIKQNYTIAKHASDHLCRESLEKLAKAVPDAIYQLPANAVNISHFYDELVKSPKSIAGVPPELVDDVMRDIVLPQEPGLWAQYGKGLTETDRIEIIKKEPKWLFKFKDLTSDELDVGVPLLAESAKYATGEEFTYLCRRLCKIEHKRILARESGKAFKKLIELGNDDCHIWTSGVIHRLIELRSHSDLLERHPDMLVDLCNTLDSSICLSLNAAGKSIGLTDIMLRMIRANPEVIQFFHVTELEAIEAITLNPDVFKFVQYSNQTPDMCEIAFTRSQALRDDWVSNNGALYPVAHLTNGMMETLKEIAPQLKSAALNNGSMSKAMKLAIIKIKPGLVMSVKDLTSEDAMELMPYMKTEPQKKCILGLMLN